MYDRTGMAGIEVAILWGVMSAALFLLLEYMGISVASKVIFAANCLLTMVC